MCMLSIIVIIKVLLTSIFKVPVNESKPRYWVEEEYTNNTTNANSLNSFQKRKNCFPLANPVVNQMKIKMRVSCFRPVLGVAVKS